MAKKKASIGDLIKSDMSRRVIGEEPPALKVKPVPVAAPATAPAATNAARSATEPAVPKGSADLVTFIAAQTKSFGLTDETDLRNFYDFLQGQALRYIRGFDAGRRFHG
jgi:hypothetical protein